MHSFFIFALGILLATTTIAVPTSEPPAHRLAKRGLWCSVDTSESGVTDWAASQAFKTSMLACLGTLNNDGWYGRRCFPTYPLDSNDPNPHPTFNFWMSHAMKFRSSRDCYNQCRDCLASGIEKGLAVTTACHYQAKRGLLGSTCEIGFDYESDETRAANMWGPVPVWNGTGWSGGTLETRPFGFF